MKQLILMRHAKSDWSAGGADHDRPLNARGRRSATALGKWMRDQGVMPDQVLCSSAARTAETLERLALPSALPVIFTRALYLATHHEILATLQQAKGARVLILGHNPGISIMAEQSLQTAPIHPQFERYPTGATLVAEFDIADWQVADWGKAIARHFVVPRDH